MSKTQSVTKTTTRTRAKGPKVKTGCITCKIRRVKCDEGRPSCVRCQKFGIECDGYSKPNVQWRQVQVRRPKPLLPASLHQPRAGLKFNDDEECRCFRLFRDDTIHCLAGLFTDNIWDYIISQASENEPFVRSCLIAIGALSKASVLPRSCPKTDEITGRNNPMFEYSLKQYGKALTAMRKALSDENHNLRHALIACLLVFCFESFFGNPVAAIRNAQSGINLLHQWQVSREADASMNVRSDSNIEDELVRAFARLDLQVSIFLDIRGLQLHQLIKEECCAALQDMPAIFKSLDEARIWCELLLRWNYHFRAESMALGKAHELEMKEVSVNWEDSMDIPMGAAVFHDPKEIPIALIPEYRAHALKTEQWFAAFEPLLRQHQVGAIQLQVQTKMSYITLASAFFTLETGFDVFLPEFQDIVTLVASVSKAIIEHHSDKRLIYHFDGGFIPPLFLVATKCRDRILRRKAIAILYSASFREGVFDSICVAKMSEWIVTIEEEGIEEGDIPDHRRLRIRGSNVNLAMRRAQLQGTQLRNAGDTEPEWKKVVLNW